MLLRGTHLPVILADIERKTISTMEIQRKCQIYTKIAILAHFKGLSYMAGSASENE